MVSPRPTRMRTRVPCPHGGPAAPTLCPSCRRGWWTSPARSMATRTRWCGSRGPSPSRARARSGCACGRAASAGRTSTSPRATWSRAARGDAGARGRRGGRPARPRQHAVAGGRPHRGALAGPHLRHLPLLPVRPREPLPPAALHRLGRRRGLRRLRSWSTRPTPTRCPDEFDDVEVAPLLCAGIIGYRALLRANLPEGGRLGIYGFGGSAHLTAQVALARGARVHVMTRSREAQQLALELGAASAGDADAAPPEPLDSAILFAPVGTLVPPALAALDRGGTLAIAGIYLSDIPALDYERHLFEERTLRSVTANTRRRRGGVPGRGGPDPPARLDSPLPDGARRRRAARPARRPGQRRRCPRRLTVGDASVRTGGNASERKAPTVPQSIHAKRCHRALGDRSWSSRLGHARRQCDQAVDRWIHYSRSGDR